MNQVYVMIALALFTGAVFYANYKGVQSTPLPGVDEFYSWKSANGKNYATVEEETYRFAIFLSNYAYIMGHNQFNAKIEGFHMGVNQFADLTNAEFKAQYLTYKPAQKTTGDVFSAAGLKVPTSVNWTAQGDVTPVKDQGSCGSCWSFSTTGSLEGVSAIFGSGLQSFSEQQLVDCSTSYGNEGCNGGLMDDAFKYVIANGITTESAYPYTGVQGKCKINGGAFKISSYKDISKGDCTSLKAAVAQQPVSVAVDAQTWQFYSNGVFSLCGKSLDHGVLATGYTSSGIWLVKNSWGASWGEAGYIQLKSGDTCGICNQASYPVL